MVHLAYCTSMDNWTCFIVLNYDFNYYVDVTTEQLLNRTPPKKVYESNHYRENLKRKLDVNNNDELPCKRLNACDSSSHSCLK